MCGLVSVGYILGSVCGAVYLSNAMSSCQSLQASVFPDRHLRDVWVEQRQTCAEVLTLHGKPGWDTVTS